LGAHWINGWWMDDATAIYYQQHGTDWWYGWHRTVAHWSYWFYRRQTIYSLTHDIPNENAIDVTIAATNRVAIDITNENAIDITIAATNRVAIVITNRTAMYAWWFLHQFLLLGYGQNNHHQWA